MVLPPPINYDLTQLTNTSNVSHSGDKTLSVTATPKKAVRIVEPLKGITNRL
jgi:hypothetical protein